ncbi:N-acylglucosamine 2-epimerase [Parapedobacter composti]|uniref:N-acylglucosamine 2-epimerase n=1 Tax=Parapedobacter composti TaxID=623281 RepID=A0A1I1KIU9_9SPHI|nr:AGE family epimerase/isomerase [Parapedobacter composti]SFC58608.1 N-acylglucosamine 2-epimerase [Parapedobacter composti]
MIDAENLAKLYRDNLLSDVIPFWQRNAVDWTNGGYFTCLDRKGRVYDTDKFVWLQARQIWMFSMLYNKLEKRQEWLDVALAGAKFLEKHGRDAEGNWYFALNREGKPLVQPYNIFSDCFAAMAFGQLFQATGLSNHGNLGRDTFNNILKRRQNPKGKYAKGVPGTRNLKDFALPMILCNLVLELEHLLDAPLVTDTIQYGINEVMTTFYRPDERVILEAVNLDGSFSDSFEGRLVNPGHGLEAMWFMMDLAERSGDNELMKKAADITLQLMEYGWDRTHGGIFYFLDVEQKPLQQLEWDQKLWWVHIEALISLAKGYLHTGDERFSQWFSKLHDYTWAHFPDMEFGEWYGYLNRHGEVLLPSKGGKWKGCFHIPRGLYQLWKTMEAIAEKQRQLIIQDK